MKKETKDRNHDFWQRVKSLIRARKVSQRELAAYVGVSLRTLEGWIYHKRFPNAEKAFFIAQALGASMDFLIGGKDDGTLQIQLADARLRKAASSAMDKLIFQLAVQNSRLFGAAELRYTSRKGMPTFFGIDGGKLPFKMLR